MTAKTMFEKLWDKHVVCERRGRPPLLYIDRHLLHEVTSPQAFEGLRLAGREVRRPDLTGATMDHNVPTDPANMQISDPVSAKQVKTLRENCREFNIPLYDMKNSEQGVIHVIMPEEGIILPGMTVVCGDSHTATHGAFGCLAFGIGTSEIEHVLATQTLPQKKPLSMEINLAGERSPAVTAKDIILGIIAEIGTDGGTGYAVEYSGDVLKTLSMEQRMTICNMSIEAGARTGMIAPDEITFEYLRGLRFAPKGEEFGKYVEEWKTLATDPGAEFDKQVELDLSILAPQVSWGTNPEMSCGVDETVPAPEDYDNSEDQKAVTEALDYMGLKPKTAIEDIKIDYVFIGSCTNGRIEDLRAAASVLKGKKIASNVEGLVVPGSMLVKKQAEKEGLDKIFENSGLKWRNAGCSMCLAMNDDKLAPGQRCASTSNRNFEGRQGAGSRTHLVSPLSAAAAAIEGHFVDIRDYDLGDMIPEGY
ncbi:MAG: 3-isopropylmalate dehydratase large subunit [bacterium]